MTFSKSLTGLKWCQYIVFIIKFGQQVLTRHYLDDVVFKDVMNDFEKRRLYAGWFKNARRLAPVRYYDKSLERLSNSGSSCQNACSAK
jgi:hypothetical protein